MHALNERSGVCWVVGRVTLGDHPTQLCEPIFGSTEAHHILYLIRALHRSGAGRWTLPVILDRFGAPVRRSILWAEDIPGGGGAIWTRNRVPAWAFPDGSHVVLRSGGRLEALDPSGLGYRCMLDTTESLCAALVGNWNGHVLGYVSVHEGLPRLPHHVLVRAFESPHEEVRLAAIASLSRSLPRRACPAASKFIQATRNAGDAVEPCVDEPPNAKPSACCGRGTGLPSTAAADRQPSVLGSVGPCNLRVILHPDFRVKEKHRRRIVRAWVFLDGSACVQVTGPREPAELLTLDTNGLEPAGLLMRDTRRGIRAALAQRGRRWAGLVAEWVRLHRTLPPVAHRQRAGLFSRRIRATQAPALFRTSQSIPRTRINATPGLGRDSVGDRGVPSAAKKATQGIRHPERLAPQDVRCAGASLLHSRRVSTISAVEPDPVASRVCEKHAT